MKTSSPFSKGVDVYSRGGVDIGLLTGAQHKCQMAGCNGRRLTVRWDSGRITHPCSKGMLFTSRGWEIL